MTISAQEVHTMMQKRYPNADVYVLDEAYEVPTKNMIIKAYEKFQRSLWTYKLSKWLSNRNDCDDFAWNFKASCQIGNALSKNQYANPIGFLCYFENGDKERGHAINNAIWGEADHSVIREVEPQPKGGTKSLTKKERNSAWLVVI